MRMLLFAASLMMLAPCFLPPAPCSLLLLVHCSASIIPRPNVWSGECSVEPLSQWFGFALRTVETTVLHWNVSSAARLMPCYFRGAKDDCASDRAMTKSMNKTEP